MDHDSRDPFRWVCKSEQDTIRLAGIFAAIVRQGDCIALQGDLGAGKSFFARHFLRALAGDPFLEVPSPTFTIVQTYIIPVLNAAHFDLYRISDPDELVETGFEDALNEGVSLVEWPENADGNLPECRLTLAFEHGENFEERIISASFEGMDWSARLERSVRRQDFLEKSGYGDALRTQIQGDLSSRSYERISLDDKPPLILMDMPERKMPVLRDGQSYDDLAKRSTRIDQVIATNQMLAKLGVNVPAVTSSDIKSGLMLSEDFGRQTLVDRDNAPVKARYFAAMELLANLHQKYLACTKQNTTEVLQLPNYDSMAFLVELEIFEQWMVPETLKRNWTHSEKMAVGKIWKDLLSRLRAYEQTIVLRDCQAPNLFWMPDRTGTRKIGVIDSQDSLIGPSAYDVASLAQDARVDIPRTMELELYNYYMDMRKWGPGREQDFRTALAICSVQRNSKILGAFVRAFRETGNREYLVHVPRVQTYLKTGLEHPVLSQLAQIYVAAGVLEPIAFP